MILQSTTPLEILRGQAAVFLQHLPRVHDGDSESVHDARVATRRIREVLPLTHEWYPGRAAEDLADRFRRIGRALGRVRDADVRVAMLSELATRIPDAASTLLVLRHAHERKRLADMRRLIKRFERLDVGRLLRDIGRGPVREPSRWVAPNAGWRRQLRLALADRADSTRAAIEHATGVYFPRRLHKARIAIKKFRYGAEIAHATGLGWSDQGLRDLRKAQDVLGDLHDRQVLIDELGEPDDRLDGVDCSAHFRLVVQVLEAEAHELHARYASQRDRLVHTCELARRVCLAPSTRGRSAAALGAAALFVGVVSLASNAESRASRR